MAQNYINPISGRLLATSISAMGRLFTTPLDISRSNGSIFKIQTTFDFTQRDLCCWYLTLLIIVKQHKKNLISSARGATMAATKIIDACCLLFKVFNRKQVDRYRNIGKGTNVTGFKSQYQYNYGSYLHRCKNQAQIYL